jgi:hypothetical protein
VRVEYVHEDNHTSTSYVLTNVISGTLTLTAFDKLKDELRGNFEVTFKDPSGNVIISNGKFDSEPN